MSVLSVSCMVLMIALLAGCTGDRAKSDDERASVKSPVMSQEPQPAGGALELVAKMASGLPLNTFYQTDYWQDGKAEVAKYEATRERYGKKRAFVMEWITVKEEFNPTLHVKSDAPGAGQIPVMKSHAVFTMPTENYDYNFAASTFFRRDSPATLVKATITSHEWCGITTKHVNLRGEQPTFEYHSYFESEHDGVTPITWPEHGVMEEQLMGLVRAIPFEEKSWRAEMSVLDRQVTSHMRPLAWRKGVLSVKGEREVVDASGTPHEVWHVVFEAEQGDVLSYDVSKAPGHVIIAHQGPEGASLLLREAVRWAYWDFSKPSPFEEKP